MDVIAKRTVRASAPPALADREMKKQGAMGLWGGVVFSSEERLFYDALNVVFADIQVFQKSKYIKVLPKPRSEVVCVGEPEWTL